MRSLVVCWVIGLFSIVLSWCSVDASTTQWETNDMPTATTTTTPEPTQADTYEPSSAPEWVCGDANWACGCGWAEWGWCWGEGWCGCGGWDSAWGWCGCGG